MGKPKPGNIQLKVICENLEQAFQDFDKTQKVNNPQKDFLLNKKPEIEATFTKLKTLLSDLSK